VQLLDMDPLQISQTYSQNCLQEGRAVSNCVNPDYQIIDTAGVLGASLLHIKNANLIIVPFRPHYADLLVIIPWFTTLSDSIKRKIVFLPNYWRNTKEQKEGLVKIQAVIAEEKSGLLLSPLSDKPARYGTILNGGKINFFTNLASEEVKNIMQTIIHSCAT
jgi:hypothetical protein